MYSYRNYLIVYNIRIYILFHFVSFVSFLFHMILVKTMKFTSRVNTVFSICFVENEISMFYKLNYATKGRAYVYFEWP